MAETGVIRVGTSGWHYDDWVGPFYPSGLAKAKFLEHYAGSFDTVEINNSFYQLPQEETLAQWAEGVPEGFTFAIKASRYITHMKKLKDPEEPVANFLDRADVLGSRLGPVLFQLPPRWRCNVERLAGFLELLPGRHRYTFEFRDPSWFVPRTYEILRAHGAAFCIYDLDGRLSPKELTGDFVYVRLHGPDGAYRGEYDVQTLAGWAGAFHTWADQGRDVYCYFDNDEAGYAPRNALRLKEMVEGKR